MRFLLLNQTFHPDVMATGQYLTEVALSLVARGHEVTVVTSRKAYDHPETRFPARERWRGLLICRVGSTGFGKAARWRRAADFASFMACCALRLLTLPRHDAVIALTSPPLISFLGAWLAKVRRSRFIYWVMDLNPDEAVAAGWLRPASLPARWLDRMSRFSLRQAQRIIVLDRFMRERICAKGIPEERVAVIPMWSHDDEVRFDPAARSRFREAHGLPDKFVVMYSGNHSPCHPLDTLLDAALQLKEERDLHFCFVGGGSEFGRVREFAIRHALSNILCLPYQPLAELAGSLSAADLHAVVMGQPFVGIVHPCKIYNILSVGAPVLYVGPRPSHISEILDTLPPGAPCGCANHGETDQVLACIRRIRASAASRPDPSLLSLAARFSKQTLLGRLTSSLE